MLSKKVKKIGGEKEVRVNHICVNLFFATQQKLFTRLLVVSRTHYYTAPLQKWFLLMKMLLVLKTNDNIKSIFS